MNGVRLLQRLKAWLGVTPDTGPRDFMSAEQTTDNEAANAIWRVHAALDAVYGKNWSKSNPAIVAQFMQALSTKELASEVSALREIIGSGTGAITVGIEKS